MSHSSIRTTAAFFFVLLVCAAGQGVLAGNVEPKLQTTVVGPVEQPGADGLWTCTVLGGRPAVYRLWRADKGKYAGGLWKLTQFRQEGELARRGGWKVLELGTLRPFRSVFCGGPIADLPAYPGGFALLEEGPKQHTLLYSVNPLALAGFDVAMEYPFLTCGHVDGGEEVPKQPSFEELRERGNMQRLSPMSVAWARKFEGNAWLALSTSGHILHVSIGDSGKSPSKISVLGGIAGVANLAPLPEVGAPEATQTLIRYSRCLGAGELREGSFTALCARLPSDERERRVNLLLFKVTVKGRNVTSESIPSEELTGASALPLVLPSSAAQDMGLHWCSVSGTLPSRKMVIGRYHPQTGVSTEHLPFNIEGDAVAGYVNPKGQPNVFVVRKSGDATAALVQVTW
jgi:hypothetical protein